MQINLISIEIKENLKKLTPKHIKNLGPSKKIWALRSQYVTMNGVRSTIRLRPVEIGENLVLKTSFSMAFNILDI